jgi:endoplasmic reticulum-Golgi intermediate compartment protein 2
MQMYQYFVSIVPTVYRDVSDTVVMTNQYALTEYRRAVDHDKGSHGMPGLV